MLQEHHKINRNRFFGLLTLCYLSFLISPMLYAQGDPFSTRTRAMTKAWSQELARFPLSCLYQARTLKDPRQGCHSATLVTQARWALLRQRRITGHGGLKLGPKGQELLKPSQWWSQPSFKEGDDREAYLHEQAWRLAFIYESLMSTGEAGWLIPLWKEMATISNEVSQYCIGTQLATTSCIHALYWLSQIAHTPWEEGSASIFPQTQNLVNQSEIENRQAWILHWQQLRAWILGRTGELLPQVEVTQSASHNALIILLASSILDQASLTEWVHYWRTLPKVLSPEPVTSQTTGELAFLQGQAFAQLATRLGDRTLAEEAQQQLRHGVSVYLKTRNPIDRVQLSLTGLWALSSLWTQPHLNTIDGTETGGFGLSYPPRLWKFRAHQPPLKYADLSDTGVLKQGMFSKIRVRADAQRRGMYFVRPGGIEVLESEVDFDHPELLQVAYTSDFLVSYALTPKHQRALIVGLGGGGMLHALKQYDPTLDLDVVEIDPVVVQLAQEYFAVDQTGAHLITRDGFEQLRDPKSGQYDVIYMDAFLQPSDETDSTGAPLRLKTVAFLKEVRARLTQQGVLMINLNEHPQISQDIRSIQAAFESVLLWRVPNTGNLIIAAFNGMPSSSKVFYQRAQKIEKTQLSPLRLAPILTRALQSEGI